MKSRQSRTITADESKKENSRPLFSGATVTARLPTWQKTGSPATSVIGQRSPTGCDGRLGGIETETELETGRGRRETPLRYNKTVTFE